MASSKVMATNHDPPRGQPSSTTTQNYHSLTKTFSSINMDEILNNIYSDPVSFPPPPPPPLHGGGGSAGEKTTEEVWKEIVAGREAEMTLEDFLTKAGADEEVGGGGAAGLGLGLGTVVVGNGGGGGRGKRRAVVVEEPPMDKATQQKQRRMIKNRESAARSRERKQCMYSQLLDLYAYTVELETLVTQLEEENARLVRQEAEESKKRFKQLMDNLIPVEDKRKPPRRIQTLRRSNSMRW